MRGFARIALALAVVTAGGGCGQKRPTEDILRDLRSKDPAVFDAAKKTLIEGGPDVWADLVGLLSSPDSATASDAGHCLEFVDVTPVIPKLRRVLAGTNARGRFWAAHALVGTRVDESQAMSALTNGLFSEDAEVKTGAVMDFAVRLEPSALAPTPRLLQGLGDAVAFRAAERSAGFPNGLAAKALARFGKSAVPTLIAALKVPHADGWAVGALGEMGPLALEAVPALTEIVKRPLPPESEGRTKLAVSLPQLKEKASHALWLIQK